MWQPQNACCRLSTHAGVPSGEWEPPLGQVLTTFHLDLELLEDPGTQLGSLVDVNNLFIAAKVDLAHGCYVLLNSIYSLKWKLRRADTYLEDGTTDKEGPHEGRHGTALCGCVCVLSGLSLLVVLFLRFHISFRQTMYRPLCPKFIAPRNWSLGLRFTFP